MGRMKTNTGITDISALFPICRYLLKEVKSMKKAVITVTTRNEAIWSYLRTCVMMKLLRVLKFFS